VVTFSVCSSSCNMPVSKRCSQSACLLARNLRDPRCGHAWCVVTKRIDGTSTMQIRVVFIACVFTLFIMPLRGVETVFVTGIGLRSLVDMCSLLCVETFVKGPTRVGASGDACVATHQRVWQCFSTVSTPRHSRHRHLTERVALLCSLLLVSALGFQWSTKVLLSRRDFW
jgi:hypothetical protein